VRSANVSIGSCMDLHTSDSLTASASAADTLPSQRPSGRRILVVDDNPDWRDLLATYLSLKGHSVRSANGAAEALGICDKFSPEVIFVDVCMPDMDGFELCARLRQNVATQNAAIYALSAYSHAKSSSESRRLGFDAYLSKPADLDAINRLCRQPEALERGRV
jgi:CheY-like chemotaxis protein